MYHICPGHKSTIISSILQDLSFSSNPSVYKFVFLLFQKITHELLKKCCLNCKKSENGLFWCGHFLTRYLWTCPYTYQISLDLSGCPNCAMTTFHFNVISSAIYLLYYLFFTSYLFIICFFHFFHLSSINQTNWKLELDKFFRLYCIVLYRLHLYTNN